MSALWFIVQGILLGGGMTIGVVLGITLIQWAWSVYHWLSFEWDSARIKIKRWANQ